MDETAYRQFVELERTHFWFVARRRIFFSLLERELGARRDLRILDVGCGAGGMLGPLSRYGDVQGIEVSEELVHFCRERGFPRVHVGSADDLPVPARSQDLVALFDTIEHIADDTRALAECRQALTPGGLVILSVPAYPFLYANNDRVAHHHRRYTRRALIATLSAAGLVPIKVTYFNTFLFPAILPVVMVKKLSERWRDPHDTTNLSHEMAPALNRVLTAIMSSERLVLSHVNFPFGHSLFALARRPAENESVVGGADR
ncbi:MAG TPA: class I SAM-dependent methyltransferase [Solirubrobacteraceae bacterium]|nr:class I SAM-dependent methyltransferase [Solirubrobacteraceae bacterium]